MKPAEFVQRNKFLIGVAVMVLAGVAAVVGVFLPDRKANAQEVTTLEAKAQSLSTYAAKADMARTADVPEAKKLTDTYQASLDDVRAFLEKQDQPLEEPLKDQQTNLPATDGSTWKLDYSQAIDNLQGEVDRHFMVVGDNPIVAKQYGAEIPNAEEMRKQTLYLRVQQYAIGAIASLNAPPNPRTVPVFNGFAFLPAPERLLSPGHAQEFTPIPFELKLSTEFTNIPRILHSLLKSPVPFEITSLSVSRPEHLDRGGEQKKAWAARTAPGAAPAPTVAAAPTPTAPGMPPFASPYTPGAPPAGMGPNMEQQQNMIAAARARGAEIAKEMSARYANMGPPPGAGPPPGVTMPPGAMPPGAMPPGAMPPARQTTTRQTKGTKVTEEIKAQLPKTLVDVTIRGYVADYAAKAAH